MRDELVPAGMTRLVGRAAEVALLDRCLCEARSGQAQAVLVEGPPGFGKSALLRHFAGGATNTVVVRCSGDEAEQSVGYGVIAQVAAWAEARGPDGSMFQVPLSEETDPFVIGGQLVALLTALQQRDATVLLVVDDLHWADEPSGTALLYALRRLLARRIMVLASARPGELTRLGTGWSRFFAGDHRTSRILLGGLGPVEVAALGRQLGAGTLSHTVAARIVEYTGGSPLYCRALLEELAGGGPAAAREGLRIPLALAAVVVSQLEVLTPAARELVNCAAVLGRSFPLAAASALAGLADAASVVEVLVAQGLLVEESTGPQRRLAFANPLVQQAIYHSIGLSARRRLHARAAGLLTGHDELTHRFAAAVGPDDALAADLERAAEAAAMAGQWPQAATWLVQAAEASSRSPVHDRCLLGAAQLMLRSADIGGLKQLRPRLLEVTPSARRSAVLGHLELASGQPDSAYRWLLEAWTNLDAGKEPETAALIAGPLLVCCALRGQFADAIAWGERFAQAATDPAQQPVAGAMTAFATALAGDPVAARARLAQPVGFTRQGETAECDALTWRGMTRLFTEDLHAAIADLSAAAARLQAGARFRYGGACLTYLIAAEYLAGAWDDAVAHAALADEWALATDEAWGKNALIRGYAALVPAARGHWNLAADQVAAACGAALAVGSGTYLMTAASARAALGRACRDPDEILRASAMARSCGDVSVWSGTGHYDWPVLEVDAYVGLGQLAHAEHALAELAARVTAASPAWLAVSVARLTGNLAVARQDARAAEAAFARARRYANASTRPLAAAILDLDEARYRIWSGQRHAGLTRLKSARDIFAGLGACPYLEECDELLPGSGSGGSAGPGITLGLTPTELTVARLVASGLSNKESARQLFVTVKAIEFHLGNIYQKLGISSRRQLATLLMAQTDTADRELCLCAPSDN